MSAQSAATLLHVSESFHRGRGLKEVHRLLGEDVPSELLCKKLSGNTRVYSCVREGLAVNHRACNRLFMPNAQGNSSGRACAVNRQERVVEAAREGVKQGDGVNSKGVLDGGEEDVDEVIAK
jgi:hypothetical protein